MEADLPKHVLFWPWVLVFGLPIAVVVGLFRRLLGRRFTHRCLASLVVACAISPALINHGPHPYIVYAFPLLFTARPSLGLVASLPPIFLITGAVAIPWCWRQWR